MPGLSRAASEKFALENLWAVAAGLAVGSGVFGLVNLLKYDDPERLPIVSCNFVLSAAFLVLWRSLILHRVDRRWAEPLIAGALLSGYGNVLLAFVLVSEPLQTNLAAIYVIATGWFLMSVRWLVATIGIMLVAWAPVARHVASSSNELLQYGLMHLAACVLAAAIFTGRHLSFRRLRNSEERYRRLFQQSKDAVAVSTPEGRLIEINPAGLELFGYSSEDEVGRHIVRDVYADPKDRERLVLRLRADGFVKDYESTFKKKSGDLIRVEGTTSTIQDEAGQAVAFLAILRDVTERKKEQEELAQHRERLEELVSRRTARLEKEIAERRRAEKERLQLERQFHEAQKLESLGVLAGGIAHDFNNLLVGMMGNASLIRGQLPRDSPFRSNLQQIELAARRAADLANEMLAYAGQGQFLFEACDLGDIVAEVANLLQTSISKKAVLDLGFATDLPPIHADITQVRQVVMNLITNASDALAEESGRITVRTHAVDIEPGAMVPEANWSHDVPGGRYVCLEVSDTGNGMDETTRAKIFDPFFSTKFDGRGLGLAAVLGIVRGHRASIAVDSTPGRGSTFRILFPASEEQTKAQPFEPLAAEPASIGGTVLLIDDEKMVRLVARAILQHGGFEVLAAEDGREGLELFGRHAGQIDLVMLDSRMPRMDGAQALRELRRLQPEVKVILCSGDPEQKATRGIDRLDGFLRKPFDEPSLLQTVHRALGSASSQSA